MNVRVQIKKTEGFEDFDLPVYSTEGAAAIDLHAAIDTDFKIIYSERRMLIHAGFSMAIPEGYEAQIRPRSGLAIKHGISLVNSPGTIDSDYRGPVGVILVNHGDNKVVINRGDRIAQMVISPVSKIVWEETSELCDTERGQGGFGSTGK
jgi:dUTP pyrophosphatase